MTACGFAFASTAALDEEPRAAPVGDNDSHGPRQLSRGYGVPEVRNAHQLAISLLIVVGQPTPIRAARAIGPVNVLRYILTPGRRTDTCKGARIRKS